MYAKGMSNRDIDDHLRDIYGVEASPSIIRRITDKFFPTVTEWQFRALNPVYPIVFFDGITIKEMLTKIMLEKAKADVQRLKKCQVKMNFHSLLLRSKEV